MDFSFSEEQLLFRDAVRDLLAGQCSPAVLRDAWQSDTGRTATLWAALADMGVVGMTTPAHVGGLDMDEVDLVLLLEESGRAALPEPLLEHTAVALPTLVQAGGPVAERWLEPAASGQVTLGVGPADGYVTGAASCELVLLLDHQQVRAVPVAEAQLVEHPSIDGSRRLYEVTGPGKTLPADAGLAFDRAAAGAAAQCVGIGRRLLADTVAYVSERHQFGKPVGSYQAVKHHLANAALRLEFAAPATYHAAWCIASGSPDRSRDVSLAKALASDAVDFAARVALQCHGAIGYTYEHDLHLWLKRGWALSAAWGDASWHRHRIATALGI